jgi:hypothetical protein
MGFCLTQIYLGVFSCLWNLFSSLFISIRLYDRMQNKNKIFKNKFMYEYATTLSYGIPCVITYILWTSQVLTQSNTLKNKTYEDYYVKENNSNFFRYMYCWVSSHNNTVLFVLSFLLIAANFYFSIFKSFCFIRRISREIEDNDVKEEGRNKENKVQKIKKVMCNLLLYPFVSGIVWIIYFILQILTGNIYSSDNKSFIESMKKGAGAWFIIIIICIRQIIFTLMFFLTQGNLKRHTLNIICCKKNKNSRTTMNMLNESNTENYKLLNESNE